MGFILIEDMVVLAPFFQEARGWNGTHRLTRLVFGLCFSILTAVITSLSFNFFYMNLSRLVNFIQTWHEESRESDDREIPITRNDEIGSIIRSLQISLFQEKEKNDRKIEESLRQERMQIATSIHSDISRVRLRKIPGMDVSLFPNTSQNPSSDYFHILPTTDGCLGILAGFEKTGLLESAYKSKIHAMMSILHHCKSSDANSVLRTLSQALNENPIPFLNLSLFHFDRETGELNYQGWQEMPYLVFGSQGLRELERGSAKHAPLGDGLEDFYRTTIQNEDYLILVSDRILSTIHLTGKQFAEELRRRVFDSPSPFANTRALTIGIANHVSRYYGKRALGNLGLMVIKRSSRSHL